MSFRTDMAKNLSLAALNLLVAFQVGEAQSRAPRTDWTAYGHDAGGSRFSPLRRITPANVSGLQPAWVFRTGDMQYHRGRFEATALFVDGTLFLSTPFGRVIALDPQRGTEKWSYDPHVDLDADYGDFANRGVSTWLDATRRAGEPCRRRIFGVTVDARIFALDAATGTPCDGFGEHGTINLTRGLRNAPDYHSEYGVTSPPAIINDLVIVGSAIADNHRAHAPDGIVRAYDVRTGELRWAWDPIPRPPQPAGSAWRSGADSTGAANAWSVISADSALGLIFVPTGSPSPDFYGGERLGNNQNANSVVALRAATGEVVWAFQVVRHDLWDYDVPAQPVLFTLRRRGRAIPALAQLTKMGHLFVLDRRTGRPLFPIEDHAVPASDVPGESAAPTQPFPAPALRLVAESLPPSDAWGASDDVREQCRARIAALRSEGIFTPPSLRGTIVYPGNLGGANWSAAAVDESRGLLVTNLNRLPFVITLVPRADVNAAHRARPSSELGRQEGTPFAMLRDPMLSRDFLPCSPPPWGLLTAVDLNAGRVKWSVPLGFAMRRGETDTTARIPGSLNIGGTMLTASGLAFVAATWDHRLRAFDVANGHELWTSERLPVGAFAMPMTYEAGGRQFVLICAGGHERLDPLQPTGDWVIAYALPTPDAPGADTTTWDARGGWTGELRVESNRYPATLALRPAGDSIVGPIVLTSLNVTGTLSGRPSGNAFTLSGPFTYPEKSCGGSIVLTGEIANRGTMLVGEVEVRSSCSAAGLEHGGFSLRRR